MIVGEQGNFDISRRCAHLHCSVGRTERSALKVLREQLFAHKSDLIGAFKKFDRNNTGATRVHRPPQSPGI